ncbi:gluconate 2-dehydrogenase subunit 3 family protein [Pigmentiphaga sp.]|uniref:gluconate 2-dehydrogenase subunit 3 family protein n=1 Tax=Pigmentiphaga sp. TaxID=1977564 RepID=UPI00128D82E8|nr:gluconate 2-dehydrogenase subunit 3 family protein [Pigmentiphaga sp.]MPS26732.1 gluconate 2-dehydrogenase subunit 3 family protein [Alcaligenaceae bacterium SAGV5]MPS53758.1 gluconate 2-dehydrogenase subunit 3 family protein [Alcaligenaceae bacterium SAGV3]MPT59930.1 gluconate 2-dehydrogenase subunit 3 family protein [Alcaligenaceae bacterium]
MGDSTHADDTGEVNNRRRFLQQVATVSGSLPFAPGLAAGAAAGALAGAAQAQTAPAAAPPPGPKVNDVYGYNSFSPDEAAFVETLVNTMCPADEYTPNGVDCGLAIYIDRQLAGAYGKGYKRYMRAPFAEGLPQQGPQLPLTPEQHFKAGVAAANEAAKARSNKTFDQFTPTEADAFLKDLGAGKVKQGELDLAYWFNGIVYPLFTQACFADPIYGGNYDKVFWRMIGYPGLPATHTIDMVEFRGKPFPGAKDPKSIADFS